MKIPAEPFARGLQETAITAVINNDPAAGSNPQYVDITGVKGDVLTPAYIEADAPVAAFVDALFAIRRHGTPPHLFYQAEGMTLGTDASTPGNDAAASGAGNNYVRITPGLASMQQRVSLALAFPRASPTVNDRGIYRLFIRQRRSSGSAVWNVRFRLTQPGSVYGETMEMPSGESGFCLVDLGLLQIPQVADPIYDGASESQWVFGTASLAIEAERESGAGTWDIDYVLLVPADEGLAIARDSSAFNEWTWDGENRVVRCKDAASGLALMELVGSIPMLAPNQTNRLHYLYRISAGDGTGSGDDKTRASDVVVKYWPQHLYVRPV